MMVARAVHRRAGRYLATLGLLLALVALGHQWGAARWKLAHAMERSAHAEQLQRLADMTAAVAVRARAASVALASSRRANDERYDEAIHHAKRAERDLADALRRGAVRLRPEWSCAAAPRSPAGGTEATATGQDGGTGLRWAGAADLVAGGERADAWITWLQRELIDTRAALVAAGYAVEQD